MSLAIVSRTRVRNGQGRLGKQSEAFSFPGKRIQHFRLESGNGHGERSRNMKTGGHSAVYREDMGDYVAQGGKRVKQVGLQVPCLLLILDPGNPAPCTLFVLGFPVPT